VLIKQLDDMSIYLSSTLKRGPATIAVASVAQAFHKHSVAHDLPTLLPTGRGLSLHYPHPAMLMMHVPCFNSSLLHISREVHCTAVPLSPLSPSMPLPPPPYCPPPTPRSLPSSSFSPPPPANPLPPPPSSVNAGCCRSRHHCCCPC
jgi:hypothetical protein